MVAATVERTQARQRLLAAARRRFGADGALAPTLDEVRRDAGVSVGALYHHFPDKTALAAAVYADVLSEYQRSFVAMLRAEAGAGERIESEALRDATRVFFGAIEYWWRPHGAYGVLEPIETDLTAALWFGPAQ